MSFSSVSRTVVARGSYCLVLAFLALHPSSPATAENPCANFLLKDLDPDLRGESNGIISPRFMRRMWLHDGHLLVVIQQGGYEGRYLSLYSVPETGPNEWRFLANVGGQSTLDQYLSGDGVLLPGGDLLLVVSSRQAAVVADVTFYRFTYEGGGEWSLDRMTPVTVNLSSSSRRHLNATIALDSMDRLFVAHVTVDEATGYTIGYSYSTNGGRDWFEAARTFTRSDWNDHKSARVTTVRFDGDPAIALLYHDHDDQGEYLRWNVRPDSEPLPEEGWVLHGSGSLIRNMPPNPFVSLYRHWSVARDGQGRLYASWEENARIYFSRFDGNPEGAWDAATLMGRGVYSSLTASVENGESFIYLFADHQDAIVGGAFDPVAKSWTSAYEIGAAGRGERRRVSSPEHFVGGSGSRLPVLFQNENAPPAPPTQLLFSVLFDCR